MHQSSTKDNNYMMCTPIYFVFLDSKNPGLLHIISNIQYFNLITHMMWQTMSMSGSRVSYFGSQLCIITFQIELEINQDQLKVAKLQPKGKKYKIDGMVDCISWMSSSRLCMLPLFNRYIPDFNGLTVINTYWWEQYDKYLARHHNSWLGEMQRLDASLHLH